MLSILLALFYGLLLQSVDPQLDVQFVQESENRILLSFSDDPEFIPSQEQLDAVHTMGIRYLEVANPSGFEDFQTDSFYVFPDAKIRFLVAWQLREQQQKLTNYIQELVRRSNEFFPGQVSAVNIFHYPAETDSVFNTYATQLTEELQTQISLPVYYRSAFSKLTPLSESFDFVSAFSSSEPVNIQSEIVHFSPSGRTHEDFITLQNLFHNMDARNGGMISIPARWFYTQLENRPELNIVYSEFLSGTPIDFPLPQQEKAAPVINWSVILLFIIWASFLLHFRYQPVYASSLFRYFVNHSFFIIDVKERRIRNASTGLILLGQHMLMTGLFFYVSAEIIVSKLGLEALSIHFPYLFIPGYELLSLFFLGVILALVLQAVSVIWIYMLNKELNFFSQILNLYSWPLHLNLITVTLLVVFNQQGSAEFWVLSLSMVYALIWFFSFNLAAIDAAQFLERRKGLNLFLTVGLHLIGVVFAIWYFIGTPWIIEPILLAVSLP